MATKRIPKKVERIVNDYIDDLKKDKLPIKQAIIFGSYAKGRPHKWSDVDLCIVSPKFKSSWDGLQYLWVKRTKLTDPHIEPIGYTPKDFREGSSLINEIKTHGIKLSV